MYQRVYDSVMNAAGLVKEARAGFVSRGLGHLRNSFKRMGDAGSEVSAWRSSSQQAQGLRNSLNDKHLGSSRLQKLDTRISRGGSGPEHNTVQRMYGREHTRISGKIQNEISGTIGSRNQRALQYGKEVAPAAVVVGGGTIAAGGAAYAGLRPSNNRR